MAVSQHELDEANRLVANQTHKTMAQFESFTIYPMPRTRYAEVKAVLIEKGYKRIGGEWRKSEDCVTTTTDGEFMTHQKDSFKMEKTYTVDEFLSKYGSLTLPLTIGEIHQLRELLKAHSPQPEPKPEAKPEPKLERYDWVFYFGHHLGQAMCGMNEGYLYFHTELNHWIAGAMRPKYHPHTLILDTHEIGHFYLLDDDLDRLNPTSYGLYDGKCFWKWNEQGGIARTQSATNLKVVKA